MSHCVAGYAEEVSEGISFFFRWLGHERATVQLVQNKAGYWGIEEHLGRGNARLSKETIQEITLAVASQMNNGLFLFEDNVAGTQYYQASDVCDEMQDSDKKPVIFRREPNNQYDPKAIEIFTESGVKLGYVPRQRNEILSQLIDSGHHVTGHLTQFIDRGHSSDIRMELFLTGKRKNGSVLNMPNITEENLINDEQQIIPMIGGITAKLDKSSPHFC